MAAILSWLLWSTQVGGVVWPPVGMDVMCKPLAGQNDPDLRYWKVNGKKDIRN